MRTEHRAQHFGPGLLRRCVSLSVSRRRRNTEREPASFCPWRPSSWAGRAAVKLGARVRLYKFAHINSGLAAAIQSNTAVPARPLGLVYYRLAADARSYRASAIAPQWPMGRRQRQRRRRRGAEARPSGGRPAGRTARPPARPRQDLNSRTRARHPSLELTLVVCERWAAAMIMDDDD